jgi:hypothetical protein
MRTTVFFTIACVSALLAGAEEEASFVVLDGEAYGAQADERGPIGGGAGYANTLNGGAHTVKSLEELIEALGVAKPGECVFIPGDTEIDLTTFVHIEQLILEVPAGVTLAGNRGVEGSPGALLFSDALTTRLMIRALGPGVRITGLRLRGPNPKRYMDHHRRAFGPGGGGHDYYYKFPTQQGIATNSDGLEVDNCEIAAFGHAGISLTAGQNHHIHHNYIHHCQYNGLGYGISHDEASSLIECNLFDWNRHSIAGTGRPGCNYIARNNIEMGTSLSHCFDMHGGRDRKDGSQIAGTTISIHNNTFRPREKAVVIRGVPQDGCRVYRNWFPMHAAGRAVLAEDRTQVYDNAYGPTPAYAE